VNLVPISISSKEYISFKRKKMFTVKTSLVNDEHLRVVGHGKDVKYK